MPIMLMPLPYPSDALAPAISEATLATHHGKHCKSYVDKVNAATSGTLADDQSLERIIADARAGDQALFNNAAQAWNHGFYWMSMAPVGAKPEGDLLAAINRDFGSLDSLIENLALQGASHSGSGWLLLLADGGRLSLAQSPDAETFAGRDVVPLLTIDLWEHAYYLDRKNERPQYLQAVSLLLDWNFAGENYRRPAHWAYPVAEAGALAA